MKLAMTIRSAVSLSLLASVACFPARTLGTDPEISYAVSGRVGASYSSVSGLVSRRMCPSGKTTLPASLPYGTLMRISTLAEQNGFFTLPDDIDEPLVYSDDDGKTRALTIINPCPSSSLEIAFNGKRHRITWSCSVIPRNRPEVAALLEELQPHFDKMPDPIRKDCPNLY